MEGDVSAARGGGGFIPGHDLTADATLGGTQRGPTSQLPVEALRRRVAEAEDFAEEESLRTAGYGHMIIRLRNSDPSDRARAADPFGTLSTTHATAEAAAGKNDKFESGGRHDKFENLSHLPWHGGC